MKRRSRPREQQGKIILGRDYHSMCKVPEQEECLVFEGHSQCAAVACQGNRERGWRK